MNEFTDFTVFTGEKETEAIDWYIKNKTNFQGNNFDNDSILIAIGFFVEMKQCPDSGEFIEQNGISLVKLVNYKKLKNGSWCLYVPFKNNSEAKKKRFTKGYYIFNGKKISIQTKLPQ